MLKYKAAYWVEEDGVHAEVIDFPGVMTCHKSIKKARKWLTDALQQMADITLLEGKPLPVPNEKASSDNADLEEPIYLLLRTANEFKVSRASAGGVHEGATILTYKAVYFIDDEGVDAEVPDFPGVRTCHTTLPLARRWLADALEQMTEFYLSEGMALPKPNPSATNENADVEEPIYLMVRAANEYRVVGKKVSA